MIAPGPKLDSRGDIICENSGGDGDADSYATVRHSIVVCVATGATVRCCMALCSCTVDHAIAVCGASDYCPTVLVV